MPERHEKARRPQCPRCGYDLRGVVSAWVSACPIETQCAECGLLMESAEVLSPRRERPKWCVEFADRWYHVPWRTARTVLMMLWPTRFWTSLRMTHDPRWGRLLGAGAVMLLFAYLCFAATQGLHAARERMAFEGGFSTPVVFTACYAAALPLSEFPPDLYYGFLPFGGYYPSPPSAYAEKFVEDDYRWEDMRWSLLTGDVTNSRLRSSFMTALVYLGLATLPAVTTPLGFVLLPISRRRAKVRWGHINRITWYSLALAPILLGYAITHFTLIYSSLWSNTVGVIYRNGWHMLVWGVPLLLVIWWTCAISRYLRMPHALGVAIAVVVFGVLTGPALVLVIWSLAA